MFGSIASAIGGGLGGMGLGALSDLTSGAINSMFGRDMASYQHKLNAEMYMHRHQWAVDDLRKAGLNPILSASGGAGSVPGVSIPSSMTSGSSAKSAAHMIDKFSNLEYKIGKKTEQKLEAETKNIEANTIATAINAGFYDDKQATSGKTAADSSNQESDIVGYDDNGLPFTLDENGNKVLLIDVDVEAKNEPFWKQRQELELRLKKAGVEGQELKNTIDFWEGRRLEQYQSIRDEYPIIPQLELFGSSAKNVTSALKDVTGSVDDITSLILASKGLNLKKIKTMKDLKKLDFKSFSNRLNSARGRR